MRNFAVFTALVVSLSLGHASQADASFNSGSTGADGALEVSQNTQLQVPESGVFNFTTVTVNSGATLTFKRNTQNTPVTILASGDVNIAGTISVNGGSGAYLIPGAGGPGGFDGGVGGGINQAGRRGEGPGGGLGGAPNGDKPYPGPGGGGGFSSAGVNGNQATNFATAGAGGIAYGNERILPLIGGSGGGGGGGTSTIVGGAGGGGAGGILIASSGTIAVTGAITAKGGIGINSSNSYAGGGAGGSIRLIANVIAGNGSISALGGSGSSYGGNGAKGRIRFEASSITRTTGTDPPFLLDYAYAILPPNMPALRIASIAGIAVPAVPQGSFLNPDIMLPYDVRNPITLVIEGSNIPTGTQVTMRANPAVGSTTSATGSLSGSAEASTATVQIDIAMAHPSVLVASVEFELNTAMGSPFYLDGELVARVRVESAMGGASALTYITESGREIPAPM